MPFERTENEKRYTEMVKACVSTSGPHRQQPPSPEVVEHGGKRLYTVTTLASSPRFGGNRTVVVCETFERAREIVETNEGDIWEYSYMLAVIEATVVDWLYGGSLDEQYWYRWEGPADDMASGGYKPIECPKPYERVIGWGIG